MTKREERACHGPWGTDIAWHGPLSQSQVGGERGYLARGKKRAMTWSITSQRGGGVGFDGEGRESMAWSITPPRGEGAGGIW